jgi:diadenylate cyclase
MKDLNRLMLESARAALRESKAACLLLFVDAVEDKGFWRRSREKKKFILVTQKDETALALEERPGEARAVLKLPPVKLTRLGQVKLSLIMCVAEGLIKSSDKVVCLTGLPVHGLLDTLMVLDLEKESEVFSAMGISMDLLKKVAPEVLESVLNIALELSSEGREGRTVGTTFVIGDNEKVMGLSRPLIMNPFKGYPEEARNILDEAVHETIKEFSLLDGAFLIREDGVVMAAGVHLDAALKEEGLMPGLGCRHMAAAGITDLTEAAAITISGSTGIVRIFRKGKVLLELERPSVQTNGNNDELSGLTKGR